MHEYLRGHYRYHQNEDELVVTCEGAIRATLPCERIPLDITSMVTPETGHHLGAHIGKTQNGTLYCFVAEGVTSVLLRSEDGGATWIPLDGTQRRPGMNAFTVLDDDTFCKASWLEGNEGIQLIQLSSDTGKSWEQASDIRSGVFDRVHIDGNLIQLSDGALLLPVHFVTPQPEGEPFSSGVEAQYMLRSSDRGRTWTGGNEDFWRTLLRSNLTVTGVCREARIPGPGGTFPGCWETGILQLADGTIMAALRYSGAYQNWHAKYIHEWNGAEIPDVHGRRFRHIMLATSKDGGISWENFRPVQDGNGKTVLIHGECNGELVQVPDGTLVLVHQRRYPRGLEQLMAHVSEDEGRTWLPDEYRLSSGFGYSGSLALEDGTIITVTGKTFCNQDSVPFSPRMAHAIRWRLLD